MALLLRSGALPYCGGVRTEQCLRGDRVRSGGPRLRWHGRERHNDDGRRCSGARTYLPRALATARARRTRGGLLRRRPHCQGSAPRPEWRNTRALYSRRASHCRRPDGTRGRRLPRRSSSSTLIGRPWGTRALVKERAIPAGATYPGQPVPGREHLPTRQREGYQAVDGTLRCRHGCPNLRIAQPCGQ